MLALHRSTVNDINDHMISTFTDGNDFTSEAIDKIVDADGEGNHPGTGCGPGEWHFLHRVFKVKSFCWQSLVSGSCSATAVCTEFLNTQHPHGMAPASLHLAPGVPIVCLQNLPAMGLSNGTRLIVDELDTLDSDPM